MSRHGVRRYKKKKNYDRDAARRYYYRYTRGAFGSDRVQSFLPCGVPVWLTCAVALAAESRAEVAYSSAGASGFRGAFIFRFFCGISSPLLFFFPFVRTIWETKLENKSLHDAILSYARTQVLQRYCNVNACRGKQKKNHPKKTAYTKTNKYLQYAWTEFCSEFIYKYVRRWTDFVHRRHRFITTQLAVSTPYRFLDDHKKKKNKG